MEEKEMGSKRVLGVIADVIPIEAIELPANLQRQTLQEADVVALADSIKSVGLIHPISVIPKEGGYILVAGYRRYCAHLKLGAQEIRANIFPNAREMADAVTLAENLERVEVNPVDEADWILRLAKQENMNHEQVARRLKKSVTFVRERLSIARMSDEVRDALRLGKIALGSAIVLETCTDAEERRNILETIIANGATEAIVRQWVASANAATQSRKMTADSGEPFLPVEPTVYRPPVCFCEFCQRETDYTQSKFARVCNDCYQTARHNLRQQSAE